MRYYLSQSTSVAVKILLGLFSVVLCAGPLAASGIGFKNETNMPVIVQGASVVKGMLTRGKPLLILPQRIGWDANVPLGTREVTIYHPNRPAQILFRGRVNFTGNNLFLRIRPNPKPGPYPLILVSQ